MAGYINKTAFSPQGSVEARVERVADRVRTAVHAEDLKSSLF
jgi:hypothetical protein